MSDMDELFAKWATQNKELGLNTLEVSMDDLEPERPLSKMVDGRDVSKIILTNSNMGRFTDIEAPAEMTEGEALQAIDAQMTQAEYPGMAFAEMFTAKKWNPSTKILTIQLFIGS